MKEYTVVKRIADDKPNWELFKDKLYAVETNEDYVDQDLFEQGIITVWNDEGHLAEMDEGEYEVVFVDREEWFKARPEHIYLEQY